MVWTQWKSRTRIQPIINNIEIDSKVLCRSAKHAGVWRCCTWTSGDRIEGIWGLCEALGKTLRLGTHRRRARVLAVGVY